MAVGNYVLDAEKDCINCGRKLGYDVDVVFIAKDDSCLSGFAHKDCFEAYAVQIRSKLDTTNVGFAVVLIAAIGFIVGSYCFGKYVQRQECKQSSNACGIAAGTPQLYFVPPQSYTHPPSMKEKRERI